GEKLPAGWGNVGTTGYEFIETLSGLLVETAGREALRSAYEAFCSKSLNLPEEIRAAKELILRRNFEGELMRLAAIASEHAAKSQLPLQRDALAAALAEIIIGFEVYRTYGEDEGLSCPDLAVLGNAVGSALAREEAEHQAIRFVTSLIHGGHEDAAPRSVHSGPRSWLARSHWPAMAVWTHSTPGSGNNVRLDCGRQAPTTPNARRPRGRGCMRWPRLRIFVQQQSAGGAE